MCRGHPLVGGDWFVKEKRRNLYLLPSYCLRLSRIALFMSDGNAEALRIYAYTATCTRVQSHRV